MKMQKGSRQKEGGGGRRRRIKIKYIQFLCLLPKINVNMYPKHRNKIKK